MIKFTDVCYITEDVARLRGFYERVFGAQAVGDHFHASIALEGLAFTFDWGAPLKETNVFGYVSGQSAGNTIVGFNVEDVDGEYARLKALGVEMLNEPATHPWGARSFQFKDPDGNILNFRTLVG